MSSHLYFKGCNENNHALVRDLLSEGADVNWKEADLGCSGLHIAACYNYGELLELLLAQSGVDVNITHIYNMTPLELACDLGHENIVRRLCQVPNIQLNRRDHYGFTPLLHAVTENKSACVAVLRGLAGVDWNVRDDYGWTPLTWAVRLGYAECLQIILSVPEPHLDLSGTDDKGRNIAQIAVEVREGIGGDKQRCLELLCGDRRVDRYWNKKNRSGETPVMFCLKNDKMEMARCLVNTPGVDLDTVDSEGRCLEDIARERNMTEILDLL